MKNEQAYFLIDVTQHSKYNMVLMPDGDLALLTGLDNAKLVYPTEAGTVTGYEAVVMVCVVIGPEVQDDLEDIAETDDWASIATVVGLDIVGKYAGRDLSYTENWGVFENHPDLDGQVQTGVDSETGVAIMTDIVSRTMWP